MATILNKLEIDVMQSSELHEASELAHKHRLSGLVIHPGLVHEAQVARGRVRGAFQLIVPVDWPKGEVYGMRKMRGLSIDAFDAEGFEIMLTCNVPTDDIHKEAIEITNFIRQHLTDLTEVRFVLSTGSRAAPQVLEICRRLLSIPLPALLRNDINTKLQVSRANPDLHNQTVADIHSVIKAPVKISGNINDMRMATACTGAAKFGVSLLQARTIIKEYIQQPDQVMKMLDGHDQAAMPDVPASDPV